MTTDWIGADNVPQLRMLKAEVYGNYLPLPDLEAWAARQAERFWREELPGAAHDPDDVAWAALMAGEDHL